jgi:hypothetical protein
LVALLDRRAEHLRQIAGNGTVERRDPATLQLLIDERQLALASSAAKLDCHLGAILLPSNPGGILQLRNVAERAALFELQVLVGQFNKQLPAFTRSPGRIGRS